MSVSICSTLIGLIDLLCFLVLYWFVQLLVSSYEIVSIDCICVFYLM
jgi:hypothetical protein